MCISKFNVCNLSKQRRDFHTHLFKPNPMSQLLTTKIHYAFIIDDETIGLTINDCPITRTKDKLKLDIYYNASTPIFKLNFPLRESKRYTSTYLALDESSIECYTYLYVNNEQILAVHERNRFLNPLEHFWSNILSFPDCTLFNITVIHKIFSSRYPEPIMLVVKFDITDSTCSPGFYRIQ